MRVDLIVYGAGMYAGVLKTKLPHAYFEGEGVVVQSQLDDKATLRQHLDWIHQILSREWGLRRDAVANGANIAIEVSSLSGTIRLTPDDVQMLFLLELDLILKVS